MQEGIYILANDVVFDQLIALVNSIRANSGKPYPICVIPYDNRLEKTAAFIQENADIFLLEDAPLIEKWESFATQIWELHPSAMETWQERGVIGVNRMGMHRRFCAFEGPFERYMYLDADTLVLGNLDVIFSALNHYDWVVYDFQYKDISHVFNAQAAALNQVFSAEQLNSIFCAGMYASKRGIFKQEQLDWILEELRHEAELLYFNGPDQSIVNYMTLKLGIRVCNLSRVLPKEQVTGCCVTSPHFLQKDNYLLDKGQRLTYLHYIGVPSSYFTRLFQGENIDIPYRDIFLDYRYLHDPEQIQKLTGKLEVPTLKNLTMKQRIKRMLLPNWAN
jgi:hypothetical protein